MVAVSAHARQGLGPLAARLRALRTLAAAERSAADRADAEAVAAA